MLTPASESSWTKWRSVIMPHLVPGLHIQYLGNKGTGVKNQSYPFIRLEISSQMKSKGRSKLQDSTKIVYMCLDFSILQSVLDTHIHRHGWQSSMPQEDKAGMKRQEKMLFFLKQWWLLYKVDCRSLLELTKRPDGEKTKMSTCGNIKVSMYLIHLWLSSREATESRGK